MPLVLAEVETINVEEKEYTVKGYSIHTDLNPKKFTNEEIAHYIIDRFYICPICNKIQRGWALYEEKVNGIILRKFFLKCKHVFTSLVGLEVVDMEYKDMFVIWLRVETINIQLIQKSHSFLYNFMGWLQIIAGNQTGQYSNPTYPFIGNLTNVNNASGSLLVLTFLNAGNGNSSYGIVIGTGSTANSTSTIALQSQIVNGTGSGQMQYGANSYTSIAVSGNTVSFQMNRTFTNNSGASITVAEVGIYMLAAYTNQYFAIERTVLASAVTVANTTPITVYYTIQLTIS